MTLNPQLNIMLVINMIRTSARVVQELLGTLSANTPEMPDIANLKKLDKIQNTGFT